MTVSENVAYGLKVRGVDLATRRKCPAEMLGIVGRDGYERRRIHRLSGGSVNAWRFARALVLNPAVLLLDERLTGVDQRLGQQLRDEISRLRRRLGATIVGVLRPGGSGSCTQMNRAISGRSRHLHCSKL